MKTKPSQTKNAKAPIGGSVPLKAIIVVLLSLIVGGGIFSIGYWKGRSASQDLVQVSSVTHAGLDKDPARLNPAKPPIPANATPEMKEFLQNQAELAAEMAELRGKAPGGSLTPEAFLLFRQQNMSLLKRQEELSKVLAQQQNSNSSAQPAPVPPGASPQMDAYLKARESLMRDEIAFANQHKNDNLADRQTAIQLWRKQNAARFEQLQQMAQAMGPQVTSAK